VWSANELSAKWKYGRIICGLLALAVISVLTVLTWFQVGCWRDSISLFDHALEAAGESHVAYFNRGKALNLRKEHDLAISDYSRAIAVNPGLTEAYVNRGNIYKDKGEYALAILDYNKAIELNPKLAEAWNNRGTVYFNQGQYAPAIADYSKAIELRPDFAWAYFNKANACESTGRNKEAVEAYKAFIIYAPKQYASYIEHARQKIIELER
jgi:tetratricopeptide (TPR) repeat protein